MRIAKILVTATAGAALLAACVPAGNYNPNDPYQRTRTGAVTGALGGAVLGAVTADEDDSQRERAIAGAVIGGLAGGIYGNVLDRQAAELENQISDSRVRIVNMGDRLVVSMPEGILFATDSAAVQPTIMNDLYTVADSLNRYPDTRVDVVGHTDNTGSAAYNQDLSQRRAVSVAGVLRESGVPGNRIAAFGRGEDSPIASNLTPQGRAQNRRVEIIIRPIR
jgi:outer membrane protein OmpA-like peptidoglycan-associated protein